MDTPDPRPAADAIRRALRAARDRAARPDDEASPPVGATSAPAPTPTTGSAPVTETGPTTETASTHGLPAADPSGPDLSGPHPSGPESAARPTGAVPEACTGPGEVSRSEPTPRTSHIPGTSHGPGTPHLSGTPQVPGASHVSGTPRFTDTAHAAPAGRSFPAGDPAPADPAPAEPPRARPADAARAALRRYTEGRHATGRTDSPAPPTTPAPPISPAPPTTPAPPAAPLGHEGGQSRDAAGSHSEPVAPATAPAAPAAEEPAPSDPSRPVPESEPGDASAARPGDAAREALRAARAQVRRAEAEAEEARRSGPRRSPRTAARPAVRPSGVPREPVSDARARDVRAFLTDAFRMPSETADSDEPAPAPVDDTTPGVPPPPTAPAQAALTARATPEARTTAEPAGTAPPSARSMAAPSRDGDHRRTFAAFPPRSAAPAPAPRADSGGVTDAAATADTATTTPADNAGADTDARAQAAPRFAETWWGNAWTTALEDGALDAKRLVRGRVYAERGHVDAITVTPGLVLAYVQGSRARPYRVQVRLRTLGEDDWERFLDAAVEHPAHIAALLDKEMPESLAECGVPLLPGPGDLEPQCSCPDRGHPCKHVAALCYQTARLLDADPFVLLLLRGRGEREVLDALSRRNATRAARAARDRAPEDLPGIRATEALAPRRLPPLPPPAPVPAHPGQPPAYPAAPGGPDPFALDQLATDAAARAHALLTTGRDDIGGLTLWQDAVRLAAARPGSGLTATTRALYASLASAAGRTPAELARAVAAWRQGGPDGLAVLEDPWDPPAGRFDRARPLLLAADLPAFRPWRNHLTHPRGHVQLRFGRDGLWYPYESEPGHDDWWPRGTADIDPVGALTGLGATPDDTAATDA